MVVMILRMLLKNWSSWIRSNQDNGWHIALVQEMSVILMGTHGLIPTIAHIHLPDECILWQTET